MSSCKDLFIQFFLSNTKDAVLKRQLLSSDSKIQDNAVNTLLSTLPPIIGEWFLDETNCGLKFLKEFLQCGSLTFKGHAASRYDVQSDMTGNVQSSYTTTNNLVIGKRKTAVKIGNGHMFTNAELPKFIHSLAVKDSSLTQDKEIITVTHKMDGRNLIICAKKIKEGKNTVETISLHSRSGACIGFFCSPKTDLPVQLESKLGKARRITFTAKSWTERTVASEYVSQHELDCVRRLAPIIMDHLQIGDTLYLLAEGSHHNMNTLYDREVKLRLEAGEAVSPLYFYIGRKSPQRQDSSIMDAQRSDRDVILLTDLKSWGLPTLRVITSPKGKDRWTLKELLSIVSKGDDAIKVNKIVYHVPALVNYATQQLVKPEVAALKPEVAALKPEVAALKPEVAALKPEVAALKPEVAALKPEVAALKPEVAALKPEVAALKPEVAALKPEVAALKEEDSFQMHPIEGVVISYENLAIKCKNPFYNDKQDKRELNKES